MLHARMALIPIVAMMFLLLAITPADAVVVRGYGTSALIGGDLTDPDNNINDNVSSNPPYYGTGYDFVSASSSAETYFSPGNGSEAALDLFDNKVGGGEAKYCCNGGEQYVTVELAGKHTLTTFTIASDNDSGTNRDPDVWEILGSNDGVNFTTIFSYNNDGVSPFSYDPGGYSSVENKVLQYDLGVDFFDTTAYKYFQFKATSYGSANVLGLSEIEFFGVPEPSTFVMLLGLGGLGLLGYLRRRRK